MVIGPQGSGVAEIVRFLLGRIEDDEAELRRVARTEPDPDDDAGHGGTGTMTVVLDGVLATDRLLADCVARRSLLKSLQELVIMRDLPGEKPVRDTAVRMLRLMARPYRDHVLYRAEWSAV